MCHNFQPLKDSRASPCGQDRRNGHGSKSEATLRRRLGTGPERLVSPTPAQNRLVQAVVLHRCGSFEGGRGVRRGSLMGIPPFHIPHSAPLPHYQLPSRFVFKRDVSKNAFRPQADHPRLDLLFSRPKSSRTSARSASSSTRSRTVRARISAPNTSASWASADFPLSSQP